MQINWDKVSTEAIQYLIDLIRINTTNPPGNEYEAVLYLQEICHREGIEATIYASASNRGNLVATLKGDGTYRPLVLLSHVDVVTANPQQWSHHPFSGEIADGYIWGRGTLDMKGMLVMELMSLLLLKRSGIIPKRDIMLVVAADEEAGGDFGMEWLLGQNVPGIETAEYVINEGGEGTIRDGVPVYACQNGEKGILWVKMIAKGAPGHASMPSKDNTIAHMAEILHRLSRHKRPLTLTETTRGFLAELARKKGIKLPEDPAALDFSLKMFAGRHFKGERSVQAMLYNTVSPTIIHAGEKANVLPEFCEVTLDCRLLPGETPEDFLEELKSFVNDSEIDFEIIHAAAPTESPVQTGLFRVISEVVQKNDPTAIVVPYLSPGGTDSRHFRKRGITAYGFIPVIISESELQRMHGIDERLSLENFERGTRILTEVVQKIVSQ